MEKTQVATKEEEIAEALTFSNDEVHVVVHRRPACRIEFEVRANPVLVEAAHKQAIKAVGKEVVLPGFRKGKAPQELVVRKYSKEIDKEWQEAIANLAFRSSEKLVKAPVLNGELKISFNMKSHSLSGAHLSLFFETEPTPPEINPKNIKLRAVKRPLVNEDKVNETLRQVLFFFASWKRVEDRPVQEGDFVMLDVDVIEEEPSKRLFSNVRFEVTDKSMAKWMKDLILGQMTGAILEGMSVPDQDASAEDQKELTAKKTRVTINAIDEANLPILDDDFAKRLGAPSLEEMKNSIEKLLNKQADNHVQENLREQMSEILLKDFPFDIPPSLIDRETRFRMQQLLQDEEYLKNWNQMTNEARKRTVSSVAEQSEKAVRMFYICRKILKDAGINVSPADLPQAPTTALEILLGDQRHLNFQGQNEMHQAEAFSRLLLERAEDYLIAGATIETMDA